MAATRTIAGAVNDLAAAFGAAGLDTPRLDARLLIAETLKLDPAQVFARGDEHIDADQAAALEAIKSRRLAHEPVGRILGRREFYGREYLLGPATLEPRPDSETLVDAALKHRRVKQPARILDLGAGTGCLLLSILGEWPEATGIGVDLSHDAVDVARTNAERLDLASRAVFQTGDWCAGLACDFSMIVSNPPYIATAELAALAPEVQLFDPRLALDGGGDGLAAYRAFLPKLADHLAPGGVVLLEVGIDQADSVAMLCMKQGFRKTAFHRDLAGIARVVEATVA
jgi:release factor glutamine methyltransferase